MLLNKLYKFRFVPYVLAGLAVLTLIGIDQHRNTNQVVAAQSQTIGQQ